MKNIECYDIKTLNLNHTDFFVKKKYKLFIYAKSILTRFYKKRNFRLNENIVNSNESEKIIINIHIRHMHYENTATGNNNKNRPFGFSYEKIFINLVDSLVNIPSDISIKLFFYYTGSLEELKNDKSVLHLLKLDLPIHFMLIKGNSALDSWLIMLREIYESNTQDNEFVYLLENDYIHDRNWTSQILELVRTPIKFDYITLYDHPDRYIYSDRYQKSSLYVTQTRHWVQTNSTCASFLTTFSQFKKDFKHFYTYRHDDYIFRKLTIKLKRSLLMPIPALSTHAEIEFLSPIVKLERLLFDCEHNE